MHFGIALRAQLFKMSAWFPYLPHTKVARLHAHAVAVVIATREIGVHCLLTFYLYLRRNPPGAGCADITDRVYHVTDGDTLGSTVLCELSRDLNPFLFLSCVAKTRGPERGTRSVLIVAVHVFSWFPAYLRHVRGSVGRSKPVYF